MYRYVRVATCCLLTAALLTACDIRNFFGDTTQAQFREQRCELNSRVYAVRLDTEALLSEEQPDLAQLTTAVQEINEALGALLQKPDPLQQPQLEKLAQHWQIVSRHVQELRLRVLAYQRFLQQRAVLSTQLAVLTDGIDRLAALVVQSKLSTEMVYRSTAMLYINERMQHSLTQLTERPSDTPIIADRFTRDTLLLKRHLGDLREELAKSRNQRRTKVLQEQVDKVITEVIRNGPLIEQVLDSSSDYLDFLERHGKLQELLEQTTQLLEELDEPVEQAKT
jgi:hypothetical protein